ncbi:Gamma-tubulin complex component protein family-containing protein [Aphelenchoides fujianensis]|nr:Gamma-tubulin complex component protein family-containing protein [Aphelenchoides fujianensis]
MSAFQSHPSWATDRQKLLDEIYGEWHVPVEQTAVRGNKVHSREKLAFKMADETKRDHQLFCDFCLALDGMNTTNFHAEPNGDSFVFAFRDSTRMPTMMPVTEFLTVFNRLRMTAESCHLRTDLGRCFFFLLDEIQRFLDAHFPAALQRLRAEGGQSETALSRVVAEFAVTVKRLDFVLSNALTSGAIGGRLLNQIKAAQPTVAVTAPELSNVLTRAHARGLQFYGRLLDDWLEAVDLREDRYLEFFIWDLARPRFNHSPEATDGFLVASDELVYLKSVLPNYCNETCVRSFQRRFLIVPELCPAEFLNSLGDVVHTGLYKHVLLAEKSDVKEESRSDLPPGDRLQQVAAIRRRFGRLVLDCFRSKGEFQLLWHRLPALFCSVGNFVLDDFVRTSEEFDWSTLPERDNAKIHQLNDLFRKAVARSPAGRDLPDGFACVEFPSLWNADAGVPVAANCADWERPLTDLVLTVKYDDLFALVFPFNIFKIYRDLFRLRHSLKRAHYLLKEKRYFGQREHSFEEITALNLLMRFVMNYENFVFGLKMPKLLKECADVIEKRMGEKKMDVDEFARCQVQMLTQLSHLAFLTNVSEAFAKHIWQLLASILKFARERPDEESKATDGQNANCLRIIRRVTAIRRRFKDGGTESPPLITWLFGDLKSKTKEDEEVAGRSEYAQLCAAFKKLPFK